MAVVQDQHNPIPGQPIEVKVPQLIRNKCLPLAFIPTHRCLPRVQGTSYPLLQGFCQIALDQGHEFITTHMPSAEHAYSNLFDSGISKSKVQLSKRELDGGPDGERPPPQVRTKKETWYGRRSLHQDVGEDGTASFREFKMWLKDQHGKRQGQYNPSVISVRKIVQWDCNVFKLDNGWKDVTACLNLITHEYKFAPSRNFIVLEITASIPQEERPAPEGTPEELYYRRHPRSLYRPGGPFHFPQHDNSSPSRSGDDQISSVSDLPPSSSQSTELGPLSAREAFIIVQLPVEPGDFKGDLPKTPMASVFGRYVSVDFIRQVEAPIAQGDETPRPPRNIEWMMASSCKLRGWYPRIFQHSWLFRGLPTNIVREVGHFLKFAKEQREPLITALP